MAPPMEQVPGSSTPGKSAALPIPQQLLTSVDPSTWGNIAAIDGIEEPTPSQMNSHIYFFTEHWSANLTGRDLQCAFRDEFEEWTVQRWGRVPDRTRRHLRAFLSTNGVHVDNTNTPLPTKFEIIAKRTTFRVWSTDEINYARDTNTAFRRRLEDPEFLQDIQELPRWIPTAPAVPATAPVVPTTVSAAPATIPTQPQVSPTTQALPMTTPAVPATTTQTQPQVPLATQAPPLATPAVPATAPAAPAAVPAVPTTIPTQPQMPPTTQQPQVPLTTQAPPLTTLASQQPQVPPTTQAPPLITPVSQQPPLTTPAVKQDLQTLSTWPWPPGEPSYAPQWSSRHLIDLAKLYNDEMKYGGGDYDVLDTKIAIFRDSCNRIGVPRWQASDAFLTMLKEKALAYSYLTDGELRRLHRRFGHPSVARLYKLLKTAGHPVEIQVLELIAKVCHHCQMHSARPVGFKFTLHDDCEFNYEVIMDIFYVEGNKPSPAPRRHGYGLQRCAVPPRRINEVRVGSTPPLLDRRVPRTA